MSVGVVDGSVWEGRSIKRDIGSWKISVTKVSCEIRLKLLGPTELVKLVRPNRDFSDSFS